MPVSKLELPSGHGDQTLSSVRFVLHGTSNATDSISIRDAGLSFAEGEPVVTTNLVHADNWASKTGEFSDGPAASASGQPGSIFVVAMPPNFHLGYAVFTTAYIDRQLKRVSGAPLRFAAARKQLAFYMSPETESSRVHIESEVANGYSLAQQPRVMLERQYVVGGFELGADLSAMMRQLEGMVANLQPLEGEQLERSLLDLFRPSEPAHSVLGPTAMHAIVMGTAESLILSQLRMMRWQGLALLGYRFYEGKQQIFIPPVKDVAEQRRRMEDMSRKLASSQLLMAELAWLKIYAIHQLGLMKIELDGALLEASPDTIS